MERNCIHMSCLDEITQPVFYNAQTPENGYHGEYIDGLAKKLFDKYRYSLIKEGIHLLDGGKWLLRKGDYIVTIKSGCTLDILIAAYNQGPNKYWIKI